MLHKSPVVDLALSFQHVEMEPIVESSNLGIIERIDNHNQQNPSAFRAQFRDLQENYKPIVITVTIIKFFILISKTSPPLQHSPIKTCSKPLDPRIVFALSYIPNLSKKRSILNRSTITSTKAIRKMTLVSKAV